jgi:hypothetical protein
MGLWSQIQAEKRLVNDHIERAIDGIDEDKADFDIAWKGLSDLPQYIRILWWIVLCFRERRQSDFSL